MYEWDCNLNVSLSLKMRNDADCSSQKFFCGPAKPPAFTDPVAQLWNCGSEINQVPQKSIKQTNKQYDKEAFLRKYAQAGKTLKYEIPRFV